MSVFEYWQYVWVYCRIKCEHFEELFLIRYWQEMVLNFKYGIQDNQEDEMARQAREMEERMKNGGGGLKKKGPLVKKEQPVHNQYHNLENDVRFRRFLNETTAGIAIAKMKPDFQ